MTRVVHAEQARLRVHGLQWNAQIGILVMNEWKDQADAMRPEHSPLTQSNSTPAPSLFEQEGPSEIIFLPEAGARFPGILGQTIVLGAVIASLIIWGTQNKQLIKEELENIS